MKSNESRKHNIDLVFLIVLFLIFTFSSMSVVLVGINSYRGVVEAAESNASARAAVAYIREVVHQNDVNGGVVLCEFDGRNAIGIDLGNDYCMYIYENDHNLMELYTKAGASVSADAGESIMEVQQLEFSRIDDNVISISVTDSLGTHEKVLISTKSSKEKGADSL
ncbi:MAG: DUF4860 domain-containing protein [Pseudobutyrivibrio sp.]|nr:DUF4860 domain-containing protein [Pseudobutyrivibrio sp.]